MMNISTNEDADFQASELLFGNQLNDTRFEASQKLISKFPQMHKISNKQHIASSSNVNLSGSLDFTDGWCKVFDGHESYQIYNVTNTNLLWKTMPKNTWGQCLDGYLFDNLAGKRHLSVLAGTNADGTHRLKPLILGEQSKLHNDSKTYLPVIYKEHSDLCSKNDIFREWFYEEFLPEVRTFQQDTLQIHPDAVKAVLLVEESFHPDSDTFQSEDAKIIVKIVPFSATGLTQPMDQGIISSCKRLYRMKQLSQCLPLRSSNDCIRDEARMKMLTYQSYTLKSALCTWMESWKELKQATLCNAWKQFLRNDEVDYVDWEGIELQDFMAVLKSLGETKVEKKNVLHWLHIDSEKREFQTETEDVNSILFSTTECVTEKIIQDEINPVHHDISVQHSDAIDSLNLLMIFTDQSECPKLHQYYLHFWECRNVLIAHQKKKSRPDENEDYLNSEKIDLPFCSFVTSNKQKCSASILFEQATWERESTDMFSEVCMTKTPLNIIQPSNAKTMQTEEEESMKIPLDELNMAYDEETEGNLSSSSSPLFCSIDPEKTLQDSLVTVNNIMATNLTVGDAADHQMKSFDLESFQDPLDGAWNENCDATLQTPNSDASSTAPIDLQLIEIKEEREDVDVIKLEPSRSDGSGTSDVVATICKSNMDDATPRSSCSRSTEEVTARFPVARDGVGIDLLKATFVGQGSAPQSSSRLNRKVPCLMPSRKISTRQTIKCKGQFTLGPRSNTRDLHPESSSQLSLDKIENDWGALFACKLCTYNTNMITYFKRHKLTHENELKPQSLNCNSRRKKACILIPKVDARESIGKGRHACIQCSYKTNHKVLLDQHICTLSNTQPSKKRFACAFCGQRSSSKGDLRKHMVVHDPNREKPFACPHCEYKSDKTHAYRRHLLTHLSVREKPFACSMCPYKTDVKASLKTHIRRHDKGRTRPFACPKCAYRTDIKSRLQRHIILHNSNSSKPFACQFCTFRTHDERSLMRHIITHNPEEKDRLKNIACKYCSFRTYHRGHLNEHMYNHKDEYLSCQHCSYRTKFPRCLKNHIKRHKTA